jgi:plastocyanin
LIARVATLTAAVGLLVCTAGLAGSDPPEPKTHTVTIEEMRFHPERLTVARGDTIVWVNKDLVPHTATSESGRFDSQTIQSAKSWKFTARTKGEFAYICTFHPTMKAMLNVK